MMLSMAARGRPTNKRITQLGQYIENLRAERGWSIQDLASRARVSYKGLCKLEVETRSIRRPEMLLKIATAFEVHPNQLLLRAALTPILSPAASTAQPAQDIRETWTVQVTERERSQLEHYLHFLRDSELLTLVQQ